MKIYSCLLNGKIVFVVADDEYQELRHLPSNYAHAMRGKPVYKRSTYNRLKAKEKQE